MKLRISTALVAVAALFALTATPASAAAPVLGPVTATNIQGVSALLKGGVNPQGLPTTYWFEYSTEAGFAGAVKTAATPAGSGNSEERARAAIGGLSPSTTYFYRLVASNSSGTTTGTSGAGTAGSFKTTSGFGLQPGGAGWDAQVWADGAEGATLAGSHPYEADFSIGLNHAGEFENQPGTVFPDGDVRSLRIEIPEGMIINPSITPVCRRSQFYKPRFSPFEASRSGESCPDNTQIGTVDVMTSQGQRRFGVFNLEPAPGVVAQFGMSPFGAPIVFDVRLNANVDGSYALELLAEEVPQTLDMYGVHFVLWGVPWGASHDRERGNCLNETE